MGKLINKILIDMKQEMTNIKSEFGGLNVIKIFYIMNLIINKQICFGTQKEMVSIKSRVVAIKKKANNEIEIRSQNYN